MLATAVFASVDSLSFLFKTERVGVDEGDTDVFPELVFFDRGFRVHRLMMGWNRKWGRSGNTNRSGGGGRLGHCCDRINDISAKRGEISQVFLDTNRRRRRDQVKFNVFRRRRGLV